MDAALMGHKPVSYSSWAGPKPGEMQRVGLGVVQGRLVTLLDFTLGRNILKSIDFQYQTTTDDF